MASTQAVSFSGEHPYDNGAGIVKLNFIIINCGLKIIFKRHESYHSFYSSEGESLAASHFS